MTPVSLSPENEVAPATEPTNNNYGAFQSAAIETNEVLEARQQDADAADVECQAALLQRTRSGPSVKQDLRMGREHQQGRINWITTILMGLFHVVALSCRAADVLLLEEPDRRLLCHVFFRDQSSVSAMGLSPPADASRLSRTPKWVEYFDHRMRHAGA